ncbi:hypothetical protein [Azospirillum sp. INR13]|uniref:hypothetical protein n=1 Tax=Azospirillum sp. INR13 TaxID=2596919 RepID=UPI0018924408|nr:hypothetical protein [Azospirillum sp. INR13]
MLLRQILVALLLFGDLGRQSVKFAPASRAVTLQGCQRGGVLFRGEAPLLLPQGVDRRDEGRQGAVDGTGFRRGQQIADTACRRCRIGCAA